MKDNPSYGLIALVALLAVAASALLLRNDFQAEAMEHRSLMGARAQTTLDALAAGIRAHGRMGRFRHERLSYILEELAQTPDILGVSLHGTEGAIAAAGSVDALTAMQADVEQWEPGTFRLSRAIALETGGHGPGGGRGWGPGRDEDEGLWETFPSGPHWLAVALDTRAMEGKIGRDRIRAYGTFAIVVLLALSGAAVLVGWLHQRRLQIALLLARDRAAHQEHLTRLGAGLAHETKNPLGIIRGQAQLILRGDSDGDVVAEHRDRARIIVDEIDRTVGQIDGFLKLARPPFVSRRAVALGDLVAALVAVMADDAREHQVDLVANIGDVTIDADPDQLRRALLNIILNALQASAPGGRIEINARQEADGVVLGVRDTGNGISPEDLPRVTDPYFSRSGSGSGLGLTLVQQIADAHGWRLAIDSLPGEGATVALRGIQTATDPLDG